MSKYSLKTLQVELGDFFSDPELLKRPTTDPLNLSIIIIEDSSQKWCLISADITELDTRNCKNIRQQIAQILGIDYKQVWLTFSHTHSAAYGKSQVDLDKLSALILDAAQTADQAASQPIESVALLTVDTGNKFALNRRAYVEGIGSFSAYQSTNCEDDGQKVNAAAWVREELLEYGADKEQVSKIKQAWLDGPVDGKLQLLLFGMNNKAIAGIVRFNAHSVILSSGYYKPHFSRDYCGILVDNLSEMWNCPIVFMQGPAGNQRTRHTVNTPEHCRDFSKKLAAELSPEKVKPQWLTMNSLAISNKLLSCTIHEHLSLSEQEIELRKNQLKDEIKSLEKNSEYLAKFKPLADELRTLLLIESIKTTLSYVDGDNLKNQTVKFEVSAASFGPVTLLAANGELGNFFSLKLYEKFKADNIIVAAYTNGSDGYLLETSDFNNGGYESAASVIRPENTEQILNAACELLKNTHCSK